MNFLGFIGQPTSSSFRGVAVGLFFSDFKCFSNVFSRPPQHLQGFCVWILVFVSSDLDGGSEVFWTLKCFFVFIIMQADLYSMFWAPKPKTLGKCLTDASFHFHSPRFV